MEEGPRGVVRGVGLILVGFALLMLLYGFVLQDFFMIWMDVPLLAIGLGMIAYAWWDGRRGAG